MRNLKLEELFVGAWVKRFHGERTSEPMKVVGLFCDGKMYLDAEGSEGDPFDVEIEEICPVQMDEDTMRGFGFVRVAKGENVWMKSVMDIRLTVSLRYRHGVQECRRAAISGRFACWNEEIRYIHELQRWWTDKVLLPYGIALELEWKGIIKEKEEIDG